MDRQHQFVQLLTDGQSKLFAYIRTLVPDADQARDVLQETNLVIWQKYDEFTEGTNFGAWACTIAFYEVKAWRRNAGRDRHVYSDSLVERLADAAQQRTGQIDPLNSALRRCIDKLSNVQKALLQRRYYDQVTVKQIADEQQRTANAVSRSLFLARRNLLECIEKIMASEGDA